MKLVLPLETDRASDPAMRRELIAVDPTEPGTSFVMVETSKGDVFVEIHRAHPGQVAPLEVVEKSCLRERFVDGQTLAFWIDAAVRQRTLRLQNRAPGRIRAGRRKSL